MELIRRPWRSPPHLYRALPLDHRALVVDARDRVLRRGETGQQVVHSPSLATGYWRDPAQTR
jgi:acyl-CoA synthetase (AMP-forming)/AMP-acid ligase II